MIGATKRLVLLSSEYELPVSAFQADLPDRRYELGDLFRLHLPSLNREIQGQYREAGFPLAFSGIRIRLVEDDCTKIGPFWQARLSSVIVGLPKRAVMRAVRNLYPRQSLERLHSIQAGQALKSTIEPEFFREITYKKANGSTGSRIHQLEQRQLRELTVCLARSTMPDRYVLTGCCLNDNGIELNRGVEARLEKLATRR
jgi:hypothetical protein